MDQPGPQDPRVYLDAFNQLPMGVILLDASGRIVLANPQAGRLLNLDAEALRWRSINDLLDRAVHPGGWPFLPGEFPLAAAVAGGQTQPDMELGIYDPSTRTHTWVTATLSPLPTAPGQPDALFMLSLADSTALRSAEQRLNETQQWLALAVHSARIGLWEWNCQTNQSIISPEWKRQLGYRDDELPSAHNEWISSLHPDDRAQALAYLEAFIADPQPVYHSEFRLRCKDGSYRWFLSQASLQSDALGRPLRLIGSQTDITSLKESEARLAQQAQDLISANAGLAHANQAKDEFLATMSHELRTPLTGILGISEALQLSTYGELNDKQRQALANVYASGQHLLALINDILDVSKIEAGKLELQPEVCNLDEICQAGLHLTRGMAAQKRQRISYSICPTDISLIADPRRLKQVLANLLSNAVKYSPEGASLGLEVAAREPGDDPAGSEMVDLCVWDTGIGIRQEDLPKLFKPFVQLDASLARTQTGTGLGLALVQRLVDLHGGSVSVESVPGQGSRFTVTLPLRLPDAASAAAAVAPLPAVPPMPAAAPSANLPGSPGKQPAPPACRLAIVDDNQVNIDLFTGYLSMQGWSIEAFDSGYAFLARVPEVRPDLVLMDIQMPGIDGLETTRRLRALPDPQLARIPVIALTSLAMIGDRERCLAAGVDEYLSKPVSLPDLLNLIRCLVGRPSAG